jgi:muramoyltetrapeptide carboxypeptidase
VHSAVRIGAVTGVAIAGVAVVNHAVELWSTLKASIGAVLGASMWGLMFLGFGIACSVTLARQRPLAAGLLSSAWCAMVMAILLTVFALSTDDHRAADLNEALNDPTVRAVITTRGGKGAYRIADRIDFAPARLDPKPLVGFSDATILHLALSKHCNVVSIHGPNACWAVDQASAGSIDALRSVLMTSEPIVLHADVRAETAGLTTRGSATGVLMGGNLDLIATAAGWSLPSLEGAILLIEDIEKWPGHIDRVLTMLLNAGHLRGVRGVAIGHFTRCMSKGEWTRHSTRPQKR